AAFAGAMAAAGLVLAVGSGGSRVSLAGLLVAGAAVSSFFSSLVWLLMFLNGRQMAQVVALLMGSVSNRGAGVVGGAWPFLLAGGLGLWALARPLDALASGEDTARTLGLRVGLLSAAVIAFASLGVAASVAIAGIIGFVGLIAPHAARFLVGARHVVLFPASALLGAG